MELRREALPFLLSAWQRRFTPQGPARERPVETTSCLPISPAAPLPTAVMNAVSALTAMISNTSASPWRPIRPQPDCIPQYRSGESFQTATEVGVMARAARPAPGPDAAVME